MATPVELKEEWGYLFGRPLDDQSGFLAVMPLTFGRTRIGIVGLDGCMTGEFY